MKVAMVLWTNGLEYDDRIRKEIKTMETIYGIDFSIFAVSGDNKAEKGITSYGIPYELVSLKSRKSRFLKKALLCKAFELYLKINKRIKNFDFLWVIDDQPLFFPIFSNKKIIWDLHEIPAVFLRNPFKRVLFHRAEKKSISIIHANFERINYLISQKLIQEKEKHIVLRNFADKQWLEGFHIKDNNYIDFKKWLGNEDYIYIQGITSTKRFPIETLSAIIECDMIKAVVIGHVPDFIKDALHEKYGNKLFDLVYFTGQIDQKYTTFYMMQSKFSIVFYSIDIPNNRYCEPNRMFQSLALGKPVIVGCNEPMKTIVDKGVIGIVITSEGSEINEIKSAIFNMINNYKVYHQNLHKIKGLFLWENQQTIFKKILYPLQETQTN